MGKRLRKSRKIQLRIQRGIAGNREAGKSSVVKDQENQGKNKNGVSGNAPSANGQKANEPIIIERS